MKKSGKTGIGIVGCGTIAAVHAEAISRAEGAKLVSVFSRSREKASLLGQKHGVRIFSDWEAFVTDAELDMVSICTPSGTHLDYGRLAAGSKKHVVVEKPIEVTLKRSLDLIDSCKRNGVQLAVIFQNRFLPGAAALKNSIEQGAIGKVFMAGAVVKWHREQAYYDGAPWRGTLALDGGGVLINQAIHTIDLLQWAVGPVDEVWGQTGTFTHRNIEGEDNAAACLRFENGAIGTIEASTSVVPPSNRKIEVHGEQGTAVLDGDSFRLMKMGEDASLVQKNAVSSGASSPLQGFSSQPHREQFEAIVRAVGAGDAPPVSGGESLRALAVVLAVYESARTGAPVRVFRP
jgi:UDP-N-acetyl-2-amino-2-deoxyglucuronate dehydrogenase